jgi:concanavalin A-like lectin/glucanase superfamily protein
MGWRDRLRRQAVLPVTLAMVGSSALIWGPTAASFTATTDNTANSAAAGSIVLSDDDGGSNVISLAGAVPGSTQTACVTVTYTGTLGAQVRLYANTGGTGLGTYLTLSVTRGTFGSPPGGGSCTGFTADGTDYANWGAGVVYNGLLSSFPSTWTTGVVDPSTSTSPTAEVWTTNEVHAYQLQVTVADNESAQSLTATPTLTWEARDASATSSGSYYANAVLADSPVGFWRLNETSGTAATDLGSGAHNGTYQNGVSLNSSGPLQDAAGAASFDGSDDYVDLGDNYGFSGTASFSVEFWVKRMRSSTNWDQIVTKQKSTSVRSGWEIELAGPGYGPDGSVWFQRWVSDAPSPTSAQSSGVLTIGRWNHVVGTYDGTTLKIYINGVLDGSGTDSRSMSAITQPLRFGTSGVGYELQGGLADVAIYTYALSASQVLAHYNARN